MKKLNKNFNLSLNSYVCFAICLLLMLVIPIVRDHKLIGYDIGGENDGADVESITVNENGQTVVNTTVICKDVIGYGGPTPIEIIIENGKVVRVKPLENQETPEFYGAVRNSNLFEAVQGKSLEEAAQTKIDAVSGATFTSNAYIQNIQKGIDFALDKDNLPVPATTTATDNFLNWKFFLTIVVILAGAIIPLLLRNKIYRTVQLLLNVAILGFWGGTFISYSLMVSFLTNGMARIIYIPAALMLVTAFIYPMFGRYDHYCNWLCPYGSIQELLGKCCKFKLKISPGVIKALTIFRQTLWFALMWLLWTGLCFDWMGLEPFAAFFFNDASLAVLIIAGVFLLLSFVVQRPYCRFVCPTGSLFKFSEGHN